MSALPDKLRYQMNRDECYARGVGKQFDAMVKKGTGHEFAAMAALRMAPGTKGSEQAFFSGRDGKHRDHGLADMPRFVAEPMIAKAKRAGISIEGKWYMGGLADYRGPADPGAWVSSTSDVLEVARKRNLKVTGIVNHEGHLAPPPPDIPLSDRLVRESVQEMIAENPSLATKPYQELREAAIDKHGAPARFKKKRKRGPGKTFVPLDA